MPSLEILNLERRQIREECEERRRGWEVRFGPRSGCPWGCDGSGWREVAFDEMLFDHPAFATVLPHGLLLFPCECNSKLVRVDNRYESSPIRPFDLNESGPDTL